MSAYTVRSTRQHATPATMQTEVFINEHTGRGLDGWTRSETTTHQLAFPPPAAWTLETVRGVLFALRRYLPAHDIREAEAVITVRNRRGLPALASFAVRARGWEAQAYVPSLRGGAANLAEYTGRAFLAPMLAALRELKAPLPLASLQPANDIACESLDVVRDATVPMVEIEIRKILARLPLEKRRAMLQLFDSVIDNITDDDE